MKTHLRLATTRQTRNGSRNTGGIEHFGFRLTKPQDIEAAAKAVTKAGGKILDKSEFCPGEPYLFCADPDGYVVEIWYELPTRAEPRPKK